MAKLTTRSSEMTVYTVLLVVSALVLVVGLAVVAMSNMDQAKTAGTPGSPMTIVR